jgi:hypothetical protein
MGITFSLNAGMWRTIFGQFRHNFLIHICTSHCNTLVQADHLVVVQENLEPPLPGITGLLSLNLT